MEDTLLQVNMLAQASSEDEKELRRKAAQILKKKQMQTEVYEKET